MSGQIAEKREGACFLQREQQFGAATRRNQEAAKPVIAELGRPVTTHLDIRPNQEIRGNKRMEFHVFVLQDKTNLLPYTKVHHMRKKPAILDANRDGEIFLTQRPG